MRTLTSAHRWAINALGLISIAALTPQRCGAVDISAKTTYRGVALLSSSVGHGVSTAATESAGRRL